jgi:ABC-2 type transport system ATP-binding protein
MQVKRGTIYGFLGPNGSGKTTTIRMLCGLLTPDSGRGTCLGFDIITQSAQIKNYVGYMTQRFSLYQDLSVRENLEFVARLYGLPDPVKAARAMIEQIGLAGREQQLAGELSGGWKQRLALGACTLPHPELLLLDEPTASLDPESSRAIEGLVHAWFDADPSRHASMWVSHDPAQAARMSERHLTMRAGVLDEAALAASAHQEASQ